MVLVGSFGIMSCGLNLQARSHLAVFLEPPPSQSPGDQAISRFQRLGQAYSVELLTLAIDRSSNDRHFANDMREAMPGIVAAMNEEIFNGNITTDGFDRKSLLRHL